MTAQTYWVGKLVVIEWTLTDVDGGDVTDATVTGTITLPDSTTVAASISHTGGSNIYRASYEPTTAGLHRWKLTSTGTLDDAEEGTFNVLPSPDVAPPVEMDPATGVGMVRLLIPDRDRQFLLFTDAEIGGFLTLEGSVVKRAAAAAIETVASNEAMVGKVIKSQDLSTDGAKVSDALLKRAAELRRQADEDDPDTSGGLDIIDFADPFTRSVGELSETELI